MHHFVRSCCSCTKVGTALRQNRDLQHLLATKLLEVFQISILMPILETTQSNQHSIRFTNRYLKLKKAVRNTSTTIIVKSCMLHDARACPFGILFLITNDSGIYLVSMIVFTMCVNVNTINTADATQHSQASKQAERSTRTVLAFPNRLVSTHQLTWDSFVRFQFYAYSTHVCGFSNTRNFVLAFTSHSYEAYTFQASSTAAMGVYYTTYLKALRAC